MDDETPKTLSSAAKSGLAVELAPLSVAELETRITHLKAEITRTEAEIARKKAVGDAAAALFKR